MAQAKRGSSLHTKYRHARKRFAELEAQQAKLERSKPRSPGKKGAKTRALNKLNGQIRAAKGQLTKARNAIAREAAARTSHKRTSKQKRRRSGQERMGEATRG
jgi:hypothetical protein